MRKKPKIVEIKEKGENMQETVKTLKQYAKEAKTRLKNGFWENYKKQLDERLEQAEADGLAVSKVKEYYVQKVVDDFKDKRAEDEAFYLKVKSMLDADGEVSNAIGRLTDKTVYEALSYDDKQRYTLSLSEKYLKAVERYNKEKAFLK